MPVKITSDMAQQILEADKVSLFHFSFGFRLFYWQFLLLLE